MEDPEVHEVKGENGTVAIGCTGSTVSPPVHLSVHFQGGAVSVYLSVDEARELGGLVLGVADEAEQRALFRSLDTE